jgi:hypothetical protein
MKLSFICSAVIECKKQEEENSLNGTIVDQPRD